MHILHVSSEYPPQQIFGLGRYVSDLSRHLAVQEHKVHVLTNSIGGSDQDIVDRGVHIHRVDFPPPPKPMSTRGPVMAFNVHLQQRAYALGQEGLGNPEVVVSHDWLTALAAHRIARRWKLPHVWTVHDTVFGKLGGKPEGGEDLIVFQIESWAARAADLVLVNSRAISEEMAGPYECDRGRIDLLHPGIDPGSFELNTSPERLAAFRKVFAEPEEILITYCGRLALEKGIDTLINAFSLLKPRIPLARLAIAGSGALQPLIEDHVRRLGLEREVRLYGYLEGTVLRHFYRVSDIHVCPSQYEPFGLVAAEAMASGTPTVVSLTGGLTDIVSSPEVGRSVPPRDPGAWAKVLVDLASDKGLRRRLGRRGRSHVLEQFSWDKLAGKAARIYSKVVSGKERKTA